MKYFLSILSFLLLAGCRKELTDAPQEDYQNFIPAKEADRLPPEPGIPFNCFPKQPGESGLPSISDFPVDPKNDYSIELNLYTRADIYNKQDPANLTTLIVQYLDKDNKLVVDTVYNGKNCIMPKETDGKTYYPPQMKDKAYTIEKKSGDLFYFALFLSPYGKVDISSEVYLNGDTDDATEAMRYEYNRSAESFHVTDYGVDYLIYSKAMYLP